MKLLQFMFEISIKVDFGVIVIEILSYTPVGEVDLQCSQQ
jgi:hypothetical protein